MSRISHRFMLSSMTLSGSREISGIKGMFVTIAIQAESGFKIRYPWKQKFNCRALTFPMISTLIQEIKMMDWDSIALKLFLAICIPSWRLRNQIIPGFPNFSQKSYLKPKPYHQKTTFLTHFHNPWYFHRTLKTIDLASRLYPWDTISTLLHYATIMNTSMILPFWSLDFSQQQGLNLLS